MTEITQKRHSAVGLLQITRRKSVEFVWRWKNEHVLTNEKTNKKAKMEQRNANMQHTPYGKMLCKRCKGKELRRKTNFLLQNVFCQSCRLIFWKNLPGITPIHIKMFPSLLSSCALLSPSETSIAALNRSERPCACAHTRIWYMHVVNVAICWEQLFRIWVGVAP